MFAYSRPRLVKILIRGDPHASLNKKACDISENLNRDPEILAGGATQPFSSLSAMTSKRFTLGILP